MQPKTFAGARVPFGARRAARPGRSRFEDVAPSAAAAPAWFERAFFFVSILVIQGAFLTTPRLLASGGTGLDDAPGGDPVNQLAFGLVLFGTLVLMLRHRREVLQGVRANALYFVLPALIVLSTAWSIEPSLTFKRGIETTGVFFFDLCIMVRLDLDQVLKIASRTLIVSLLASVIVALALPAIGRELGPGLNGEWRGVFAQKNQLGHVMAVGAVIQLIVMLRARRLLVGASLLFAACLALVALSQSATSLLAAIAATSLALAYAVMRRGLTWGLVAALVAAAVLCLLVSILAVSSESGLAFLDRDSSFTGRSDLWPPVIDMVKLHPLFGWGFEAFWTPDNPNYELVRDVAGWPAPNAHNGLLEVALDLGLVGVAALVVVLIWCAWRAVGAARRDATLGMAILLVLVALTLSNVTESYLLKGGLLGWNLLTILVFHAGLRRPAVAGADRPAERTIVARAKPRLRAIMG
jgi:O-antigen ligase